MKKKQGINRRGFLKTSSLAVAGAGLLSPLERAYASEKTELIKIKQYRNLGRTGFKASDIGAGKPMNPAILKTLMDAGVNYIDTAESYGGGASEKAVGEAIQGKDRKSLFINSKLSMRGNPGKEKILSRAYQCLERLQTDYLDCMMMHSCPSVKMLDYEPFHAAMKQLKKEKKLRFVGVSNHGGNYNNVDETMEKVLTAAAKDGRFDHILLVYNFLKKDMGEKILEACSKNEIATTLMKVNPVGSYFAYNTRLEEAKKKGQASDRLIAMVKRMKMRVDECQDFIKKHKLTNNEQIKQASYRFVLSNKHANSALFNFNNFEDINSMLSVSGAKLTLNDQNNLKGLAENCNELYCRHACGTCEKKCPKGVPVNTIMRYNYYFETRGQEKYAMTKYSKLATKNAAQCYDCSGHCESHCPYGVQTQSLLLMAHNNLTIG